MVTGEAMGVELLTVWHPIMNNFPMVYLKVVL